MKGNNNSTNSTIENNNNNNNDSNNNKLEVDKGKLTISKLTTSAKTLFNEVISTTTTPNLENFVNNNSNGFIKPSSSSIINNINSNGGSSIFKHQGWKEHISNQNQSNSNNNNNDLYLEDSISEFRSSGEEEKYQNWINDNNYNYGDEYNDYNYGDEYNDYDYVNTNRSIQEKDDDDDGREIIEFLNSNNYTSEIYNNTIEEEERKRREIANIDANASYNYKDVEGFLESEDILEYLKQTRYTDDVYGIPKFIKKLIKEARDEMLNDNDNDQNNPHQKTALERLKMIRDHLLMNRDGLEKGSYNINIIDSGMKNIL